MTLLEQIERGTYPIDTDIFTLFRQATWLASKACMADKVDAHAVYEFGQEIGAFDLAWGNKTEAEQSAS